MVTNLITTCFRVLSSFNQTHCTRITISSRSVYLFVVFILLLLVLLLLLYTVQEVYRHYPIYNVITFCLSDLLEGGSRITNYALVNSAAKQCCQNSTALSREQATNTETKANNGKVNRKGARRRPTNHRLWYPSQSSPFQGEMKSTK